MAIDSLQNEVFSKALASSRITFLPLQALKKERKQVHLSWLLRDVIRLVIRKAYLSNAQLLNLFQSFLKIPYDCIY